MTAASLPAVGEVVQHGAVEKLSIGANNLAELGSADQCVQMRNLGCKKNISKFLIQWFSIGKIGKLGQTARLTINGIIPIFCQLPTMSDDLKLLL